MPAWTGVEIQEERTRLEREAASVLGFMLFEYSRLDRDLGLLLAWANDGRDLEALSKKLSSDNFNAKLGVLEKFVQAKFAGRADALEAYATWGNDAHQIRSLRNQLFHGRWGVSPTQQLVSCVIGLPTSPDQREISYSLADLQDTLESIQALRTRLQKLRDLWPV